MPDRLLLQRYRRATMELADRQSTGPESRLLARHQARLPNHLLQHLSLRSLTGDLTLPVQLRCEPPTHPARFLVPVSNDLRQLVVPSARWSNLFGRQSLAPTYSAARS